ncbi:MAG: thymidylate kinase [Desulfobulbaceae bacterium BRH_c16a]|nr:MAG: thymidylate kinase [Desulfobulbaceae bacterium BRH_c16a]
MKDKGPRGKLIVFEGTDGTGKSTQLKLLGSYLEKQGYPVVATREPTNGSYGRQIRNLYVNRHQYSREEELELFLADRREHVHNLLQPCLQQGKIILCDRYYFSTAAYQGALGLNPETILEQNSFAPEPDLVLLFQAPLEVSMKRITCGRGDTLNNFEQLEFLEKVAAIFASIHRPYIRRIDASGSIETVRRQVVDSVTPLLSLPSAVPYGMSICP